MTSPARLAATDPNEQVKEMIGSGPYKFAAGEWQPGNKVVYLANTDRTVAAVITGNDVADCGFGMKFAASPQQSPGLGDSAIIPRQSTL